MDVLDGSQLLSVVFVSAERIEIDLLSEALVLVLDQLENIGDLLAVKDFVVVHAGD